VEGYGGDVISSALYAGDIRFVGRSFKYHRPRGSYSLADHDANALFSDGTRTHLRGDAVAAANGMDLRAVNTRGGLAKDALRITGKFGRFMPVGFYYKAFFRPKWLFPQAEKLLRRVAGLGEINRSLPSTCSPKDYDWCDVLVVGSGPSGMRAALAAAECGADVLLVEESARIGGSLGWQRGGESLLQDLGTRVTSEARIRIRTGTMAGVVDADHWIGLFDETRLTKLRARAVVFATGAIEQPAVFQNNEVPGVMLASAALRLVHRYAVKPFDDAVILTANADGYRAALDLHAAGTRIAALVDLRPSGETSPLADEATAAGIPLRTGCTIYEAQCMKDKTSLSGAVLCPLNADGQPMLDRGEPVSCDGIAVSVGWMPNSSLPGQAGVTFTYNEVVAQFVPESIPPAVFLAGRVTGIYEIDDRLRSGEAAGLAAAQALGLHEETLPSPPKPTGPAPSHPYPVFAHPGKKNFVDFDEDVHLADFAHAHQEGYDSVELMKRYSTVGMGPSQGKLSNMNATRIVARLNGQSINETGTTTARPFTHPVPIGHLAGRRFHPMRHTPIHDWHVAHDGEMIHAGSWYRPEYYRKAGETREQRLLAEATAVRRSLGLIDLSTLGKLFINGPDAVEFLERIYTSRFAKLAVGKQRYAVALDESGVVVEDGVVARLAEDVFYVTATSSGAEGFYRDLQRWASIWAMNVTLVNATGNLAAINIAGPRSREVIAKLTDIDVSAEAFPYLGVREGRVAGVRAMLLRVGFVGELGYEVHLPASRAMHVWNALLDEGKCFDLHPFGIEAQRMLRMEKGHLIVGHDTDALTNPVEADVVWSIGKNKPFFIGQRSLDVIKNQPLERKLVGLQWPAGYPGPLPEECHLVIDVASDQIVGRVTSIARRSTIGYPVGMGLLHPEFAKTGTRVTIQVDNGTLSRAKVVALPHYDPENERQT